MPADREAVYKRRLRAQLLMEMTRNRVNQSVDVARQLSIIPSKVTRMSTSKAALTMRSIESISRYTSDTTMVRKRFQKLKPISITKVFESLPPDKPKLQEQESVTVDAFMPIFKGRSKNNDLANVLATPATKQTPLDKLVKFKLRKKTKAFTMAKDEQYNPETFRLNIN